MKKTGFSAKQGVLKENLLMKRTISIVLITSIIMAVAFVVIPYKTGHENAGTLDEDIITSPENALHHGSSWDIMINEVKFDGPGENWAEIYNLEFGAGLPINISEWYFGDLDGAPVVPFVPGEGFTLDPGDLVVIHFSNGVNETDTTGDTNGNGYLDLYVGNIITFEPDDQLILYEASGGMYDAVCWADQDGMADDPVVGEVPWLGSDVKSDVELIYNTLDVPGGEASWWIVAIPNAAENDCVFVGPNPGFGNHLPGDTIGRADDFMFFIFDQNRKDEWMNDPFFGTDTIDGGMQAGMATQGEINIVYVLINEVKFDGSGELWAEIYNAGQAPFGPTPIGASVDISTWNLTDLDEDTDNGGSPYPEFASSSVILGLDEFAVVHFSVGVDETGDDLETGDANGNGYWDLYTGMNYNFQDDDQLVLVLENGNIKDSVCWSNLSMRCSDLEEVWTWDDDLSIYLDISLPLTLDDLFGISMLPPLPAIDDACVFGRPAQFDGILVDMNILGTADGSITWEYWNGVAWLPLAVTDNTNEFSINWQTISWTPPGDWTAGSGGSLPPSASNFYYVRARFTIIPTTVADLDYINFWVGTDGYRDTVYLFQNNQWIPFFFGGDLDQTDCVWTTGGTMTDAGHFSGQTIGRPLWVFMEGNNKFDWMDWSGFTPPGGIDAWMTTKGERNVVNIVINEVQYDGAGEYWVELYYLPSVPGPFEPPIIDISSWSLTDLDETPDNGGSPYPQFASGKVNFGPDEYVIIHFSDGTDETGDSLGIADTNGNGYWDLYVGDIYTFQEDDQLVISKNGIICRDAVCWANQNTLADSPGVQEPWAGSDVEGDITYLAVRYLWEEEDDDSIIEEEDCVFTSDSSGHLPGDTIGRDSWSSDWSNDRTNWMYNDITIDGGRDAGITTYGLKNAFFLKLNEVKYDDPGGKNWVELYNRETNSIEMEISSWTLDNLDFAGSPPPLSDGPTTISLGEYVVVHFENGINETDFVGDFNGNGYTDLYVGAYSFDNDDQIMFRDGTTVIDTVCWSDDSGAWDSDASGSEEDDVATIRDEVPHWTAGDPPLESECVVTTIGRGHSLGDTIGRSTASGDSNQNSDWYDGAFTADGGRNAWIETPGRRNAADIVINEVVFDDPGGDNWAEIYNDYSGTEFDISSWMITSLDGISMNLANDTVTISYDEYIVVHFTDGTNETDFLGDLNGNGYTDLYLGVGSLTFDDDDQLALQYGPNYIDAVCWADGGGWANDASGSEQADVDALDDAVRPQWDASEPAQQGNCVYTTNSRGHRSGDSIGRDSASADTTSGGGEEADWGEIYRALAYRTVDGGENAGFATPGYRNYVNIVINEVMFDDPGGNNWVELYNKGPVSVNIQESTLDDYDPFESGETFATSSITMDIEEYVVVHFNDGATPDETDATGDTNLNGFWDIYVSANPTFTNDDQVVFTSSGNYLLDAVSWSDGKPWDLSDGGDDEWQDVDDIDDYWTQWEVWNSNDEADRYCVNVSAAKGHSTGETIGLNKFSSSTTTGRYYDWMLWNISSGEYITIHGGRDAGLATQGMRNYVTLLINEINFDDPGGNYWAELYNPGSMGLDINGWTLDDLDFSSPLEPIVNVPYAVNPGEYIVVHFNDDTADETAGDTNGNGYRDFYISTTVTYSFESDDQLVINDSLNNIKDAVCWADQDGTYSGTDAQTDVDFIIGINEWGWSVPSMEINCVYTSAAYGHLPGYTVGRDKESQDNNRNYDWMVTWPSYFTTYGGRDSGFDTAGSQNFIGIMINEIQFDGPLGNNWAELYNKGPKTINIQDWTLTDMDGSNVAFSANPISFAPGDYAVVHFFDGTDETDITGGKDSIISNGYWDLYVGAYTFEEDDQLVLTTDGTNFKDAVCWANQDGTYDGTDAQDDVSELATKVQWNSWFPYFEGDNIRTDAQSTHNPGETIGRDMSFTDSNNFNDWMEWVAGPGWITPFGGKDAWAETKGAMNFGATTKISISIIGNDIRLDWEPSPADGVTGYRVYESTTIDGFDFGSYASTAGDTWTFPNHAVDGFEHYYIVRAVDSSGNISANSTIIGKHIRALESGWNMISLPFEPENTLLPNVLQTISGNYDVVWAYDAVDGSWHSSNDDLTDIDHKIGIMIHMNTPDELVSVGRVEMTTTIQLYEGWNFVGYDYHFSSKTIEDSLIGLPYTAVQWYDASDTQDKWKHNSTSKAGAWVFYNDLQDMEMGNGYWIFTGSDCTWVISNK
ncbi:MAG: lamin tail domain-containing protein [Thermoplasmata archaeon]|nr:MAG: lamin tail domain-containing protein [Thermoplasmata archaeon]